MEVTGRKMAWDPQSRVTMTLGRKGQAYTVNRKQSKESGLRKNWIFPFPMEEVR